MYVKFVSKFAFLWCLYPAQGWVSIPHQFSAPPLITRDPGHLPKFPSAPKSRFARVGNVSLRRLPTSGKFFWTSCEQWQVALVSSNCQFDRKANKILADHLSRVFAVVFVLSVCGLVSGLKWFAIWQEGRGEGHCDVIIIGWIARHRGLNGKYRCCQLSRWVMSRAGNVMNVRSTELGWDVSNCNFEFDSSLSLLWWYRIDNYSGGVRTGHSAAISTIQMV